MATLKAMFKLFDGYSTTIDKISRGTDNATDKIIKASRGTDEFNDKLNATGVSASRASLGLGKFISIAALIAGAVKGMNITDEFMNTSARLSLINDGLQTQAELQDKIFAAADRSRGSYNDMADAVAKMGLLAGDAFGSNDELIAFTELMQKSFKIGGADTAMQQGAMRQLTQAMASGRLQGDELTSIMENAPMMYDAIAKYTGKSKGELKEMGSQGKITADIIKNSMFMAANDINTKFETLPMTFADIWNKIKNGAMKAFRPIINSLNTLINTKGFQTIINVFIVGINLLAKDIEMLINFIIDNWDVIWPILAAVGSVLLQNIITKLWGMITPLLAQFKLWKFLTNPIFLTVLAIGAIISILNSMGITAEQVFGFIVGSIYFVGATFKNLGLWIANVGLGIWNVLKAVTSNIKIAFSNTWIKIQTGWLSFVGTVLEGIRNIINWLNKIPGVSIDTNGISNKIISFANKKAMLYMQKQGYEDVGNAFSKGFNTYDAFSKGWASDAYNSGYAVGVDLKGKAKNFLDAITKKENPYDNKGFDFEPVAVKGTGKDGAVKVDMSDEDLKYLRDIAERDYINKFSTATLAPNITVQFGDVHEEADANKVAGRIKKILQEEIATAAEGAY